MTNEEAIEFLKQYINSEVYTDKCLTAHAMAIYALQSVGKDINVSTKDDHFPDITKTIPLTIEELRKMDGQPVWMVLIDDTSNSEWMIVCESQRCCEGKKYIVDFGNIGKLWLAYAYPTAHIDREAWNCDLCNSGNLQHAGFDDRIYLSCGSSRPPENERFQFCPKCGRPLTEEAWSELEKRLRG